MTNTRRDSRLSRNQTQSLIRVVGQKPPLRPKSTVPACPTDVDQAKVFVLGAGFEIADLHAVLLDLSVTDCYVCILDAAVVVFSKQLRYLQHENIYIRADRFRPAFLRFPCSSSHLMLRKTPSRTDFSDVRPGSSMSMRSPSPFSSLPPLRTRMRGDSVLDSRPPSSFHSTVIAPACVQTVPTYSNRTIYRFVVLTVPRVAILTSANSALPLEVHLFSPSIKSVTYGNPNLSRLLSVYGEHDQIQGRVIVDPSCSNTGQLVVSVGPSLKH